MDNANLEKVPQRHGSSWRYKAIIGDMSFCEWHYHHEYELVLYRHCDGIGSIGHLEQAFSHNTLWLIGPNTPHSFTFNESQQPHRAQRHVVWIKKEWLSSMMFSCSELRKLEDLFKRAEYGLEFSQQAADKLIKVLEQPLSFDDTINQLAKLIQVLAVLAADKNPRGLLTFSHPMHTEPQPDNAEKIDKLINYLDAHYQQAISLADVSNELCCSESSVHRLFDLHFNESFSQYLKKLRLSRAAQMLTNSSRPIALIAESVGYRNQANFNRLFKQYKGMTPRQYRQTHGGKLI